MWPMANPEGQSPIDRYIRGNNAVDPEAIAAYKKAMRAISDEAESTTNASGPAAARAALEAANEKPKPPSKQPRQSQSPKLRISTEDRERGLKGVASAREALERGSQPDDAEAEPNEPAKPTDESPEA